MVEVKENKEFKDQKVINGENMKQGWEIKKLGDIAYIGLGFTHTPEYVEKGVAFLSVKDISGGEIRWDNIKYVSQEEYDAAPKGAIPNKGDILFCRVGTMGTCARIEHPFSVSFKVGLNGLNSAEKIACGQLVFFFAGHLTGAAAYA